MSFASVKPLPEKDTEGTEAKAVNPVARSVVSVVVFAIIFAMVSETPLPELKIAAAPPLRRLVFPAIFFNCSDVASVVIVYVTGSEVPRLVKAASSAAVPSTEAVVVPGTAAARVFKCVWFEVTAGVTTTFKVDKASWAIAAVTLASTDPEGAKLPRESDRPVVRVILFEETASSVPNAETDIASETVIVRFLLDIPLKRAASVLSIERVAVMLFAEFWAAWITFSAFTWALVDRAVPPLVTVISTVLSPLEPRAFESSEEIAVPVSLAKLPIASLIPAAPKVIVPLVKLTRSLASCAVTASSRVKAI